MQQFAPGGGSALAVLTVTRTPLKVFARVMPERAPGGVTVREPVHGGWTLLEQLR